MDKFGPRVRPGQKRRKALLYVVAFSLPAIWFACLFAFGNRGAPWAIGAYLLFVGGLGVLEAKAVARRLRLWASTLKVQPEQGPGFTPLELAALDVLFDAPVSVLATAEVSARYNSGQGCTVTLSGVPAEYGEAASGRLASFRVAGVEAPVTACLWFDPAAQELLVEFFTSGSTDRLDWRKADFEPMATPPGIGRPVMAPVVTQPSWKRFHYEG